MEQPRVYYSADKMLRYNPLWALICGERSVGKSFEFKKRSINTPNTIWIYLRRTDTLRKDPKNWKTYTSDLLQKGVINPDAEYKISSEGVWVDGVQKVIFSALSTDSTAHSMTYLPDDMKKYKDKKEINDVKKSKLKGRKVDDDLNLITQERKYELTESIIEAEETFDENENIEIKKKIVFEEMLEPKGKYLPHEITLLFEFYNTVDRYTGTQLFGLANLMSAYNPYFEYFGIRPFTEEFKWFKNKTLLVQNVKIKGMEEFVKSQRFYNLVEGTEYGDYLCNNTPWQDDNAFIQKKSKESTCKFNIRYKEKIYGVWTDDTLMYFSTKFNPQKPIWSGRKSAQEGDMIITKNDLLLKYISSYIDNVRTRYENITIRDMVYDIINGGYKDA